MGSLHPCRNNSGNKRGDGTSWPMGGQGQPATTLLATPVRVFFVACCVSKPLCCYREQPTKCRALTQFEGAPMLTLCDRRLDRNCQGLARREFLKVGALGFGGLLTLPHLL